jgi:DNA-binding NtrC family response regulator
MKPLSRLAPSPLLAGNRVEDHPTIQQIADTLASAGLREVRLDDLERAAIDNALAANDGCRTRAARSLGISVRTLQRKLRAWGIQENPPPITGAVRSRRSLTPPVVHPGGLV